MRFEGRAMMAEMKREIVWKLIKLCQKHKINLENSMCDADTGIFPAQLRILMQLSFHEGVNQKELARILQVSPATITVSIKKLVKDGYVAKETDSSDSRYNILEITPKGYEVIEKSRSIVEKIDESMFEGFTEEEQQIFMNYLDRISANLGSEEE